MVSQSLWEKDTDAGESLGPQTRYELQAGSPEEPIGCLCLSFFHLTTFNLHTTWRNGGPCLLFEPRF